MVWEASCRDWVGVESFECCFVMVVDDCDGCGSVEAQDSCFVIVSVGGNLCCPVSIVVWWSAVCVSVVDGECCSE